MQTATFKSKQVTIHVRMIVTQHFAILAFR